MQKTEGLTIRLNPMSRFMLEFVARLRGQTITAAVERAISEAADRATVTVDGQQADWRDFWSHVEAERQINVAREKQLYPSFDEIRRLRFAERFWPYFFTDETRAHLEYANAEVLWPRIDEFIDLHDKTKASDPKSVERAMDQALENAGLSSKQASALGTN